MTPRLVLRIFVGLFCWAVVPSAAAVETVTVVIGKKPPNLERFAAGELAGQFKRLFGTKVSVVTSIPKGKSLTVVVGSPASNSVVRKFLAGRKLTDQTILLKSTKKNGRTILYVVGGSPRATLWAVYELGYRFGIRYLLREDIYPRTPIPLKLDGIDLHITPQLRTRAWRTDAGSPAGSESWSLADIKRILRQLAKLKFNRVTISVAPWHPFVHYEFRGVKKRTAVLWRGERFPIRPDFPGRKAFGGKSVFENPDFAGITGYKAMTAAGVKHLRGIIREAHRLGMSVGLSVSPLEFPAEFSKLLSGTKGSHEATRTVAPSATQSFDDPVLRQLVTVKIRAYLKTYPGIDALDFRMPESAKWHNRYTAAWIELSRRIGGSSPAVSELLKRAAKRGLSSTGKEGVRSLKNDIVSLAFVNRLIHDSNLLLRPDGKRVALAIASLDPELFPFVNRMLPTGVATVNRIDRSARRVVENRKYLSQLPAKKIRSRLVLALGNDSAGVLPQSSTRRLETLINEIRKRGWDGFSAEFRIPAELAPSIHFLSRAAWDSKVTARSAHDDLFKTITGKQSIADRLWLAFGHLEQATEIIDRHGPQFGFPANGMLMKHDRPDPLPKWWDEVNTHFTQSMIELYRSQGPADLRSQPLLFYYAKRGEYALDYLKCVKAVREAALARKQGNKEKATEHLETAVEAMYNAINTLSDVVRDRSDRGLIAVLNAYAYRPLTAKLRKFEE